MGSEPNVVVRPVLHPSVQRWLQDHCASSPEVVGGLVLLGAAVPGQTQPVAEWPAAGTLTPALVAAARAAVERGRPVVVAPTVVPLESKHNRVIALPLQRDERTLGAVALALFAEDSRSVERLFNDLRAACIDVAVSLAEELQAADARQQGGDAARILELQDTMLRRPALAEGALAMLGDLAAMLGCERVSLGVVETGAASVIAVSNQADFKGEQGLLRLMAEAMQEAIDQGASVVHPAGPTQPVRIVLAHAELHARCAHAIACVPLVHGQRAVGALLAEWRSGAGPGPLQLALLESLACAIGPVVALGRRAESSWRERTGEAIRAAAARLVRRDDPLPKLALAALVAASAAALWLPVNYHIGASARIEGAVQRVVAAPMDGFLHKSHARPGDTVRAGDLLVELSDQDLALEQRKWQSALNQHENSYAAALARADRAQFVITQGKADEARAQLELVSQQLARTRLTAPIDGVVIKGDLSQSLGAPVQRGDALLTVAPAEQFRLVVEVDERDVAEVRAGQKGRLALASLPGEPLDFVVERVTPVAAVRDGRNGFEVEARLLGATTSLRPGLQGVAKIEAGERSMAWIWVHRAVDWVRLALWSWGV